MMTKIGNMQKIMISLNIFAEEKSFLNWPENLPLKYQALVSGHPVYIIGKRFKIESSQKHMACMICCIKYEVKSE